MIAGSDIRRDDQTKADIIRLAMERLHLTPEEQEKFNASCKTMSENYQLSLTL